MMVNVILILWLLFMIIALVLIGFNAYTDIKTDYRCLCDAKELKSLKKTVAEQQKTKFCGKKK